MRPAFLPAHSEGRQWGAEHGEKHPEELHLNSAIRRSPSCSWCRQLPPPGAAPLQGFLRGC